MTVTRVKGLLLDGTDGYAELPDNILSSDMTVTTWVKINKFTTWGRVFDFGTDSNQNFFFAPVQWRCFKIGDKKRCNR